MVKVYHRRVSVERVSVTRVASTVSKADFILPPYIAVLLGTCGSEVNVFWYTSLSCMTSPFLPYTAVLLGTCGSEMNVFWYIFLLERDLRGLGVD